MSFTQKIINWLHKLPHLTYRFKLIKDSFNLDINGPYVQSLVVFCGLSLLLAVFFLLGIVITWICQCCFKKTEQVKSYRNIRQLSATLFLISVVCFMLLGGCLYGNEHTNKSITAAGIGLADFNHNTRFAIQQAHKLNYTQGDTTLHLEELTSLIEEKSKRIPDINQSQLRETNSLLTELLDEVNDVKKHLLTFFDIFSDIKILDNFSYFGDRIEFERWILCLTLLTIMIGVLFAGVIAFCRQSRKGAIIFSGLGIVIFLVTWLLFSIIFPATVAFADFCHNGRPFLRLKLNDAIIETFEFYQHCTPNPSSHILPQVPVPEINGLYKKIKENQQKLERLLILLFNQSEELEIINTQITTDITNSFKLIGALESTLSCYNMHQDIAITYDGFCNHGFLGLVIVTTSMFLLGFFLFILLILVSKSWYIFDRSPTDYVEVGDDDHFSPRGQDTMPENVYDTNVFNPRARQFGGVVDVNGSILNGITETIGNGTLNHTQNSPLVMNGRLNNEIETNQTAAFNGTWLRNNVNLASAPSATNTQQRNSNNYYRLSSNNHYRGHYHQPNSEFQEQFDI